MTIKNLATIYSAELEGIDAKLIEVEIDLNVGIHEFTIVGLADKALKEAKERVNSAIKNSGAKPPNRENRKITINLAPADFKKTGSQYDLAIALGYLAATKQIAHFDADDKLFLGELSLDGRLRSINGALNVAQMAGKCGFKYLFLPVENANEAAAIKNIFVIPIKNLRDAIEILNNENLVASRQVAPISAGERSHDIKVAPTDTLADTPDFSEVKGQENAKRALVIAAAGNHNLLMVGPPGVGKSFLASAFTGILPTLTPDEAIEATKIWSAAGLHPDGLLHTRPFRAPHHTASVKAIIGGGQDPRPGEISLAHRGVLFLDELPEFQQSALEALRQPMESGSIVIARAKETLTFPANFILIAAMNPCPCGYYGDTERECKCSAYEVIRYQRKLSGPLLDRIDLQVKLGRVKIELLRGEYAMAKIAGASESDLANPKIKIRIESARAIQRERFGNAAKTNSEMSTREIQKFIKFDREGEKFLITINESKLSPRAYFRLIKVARTIADLESNELISAKNLAEAFSYRLKADA